MSSESPHLNKVEPVSAPVGAPEPVVHDLHKPTMALAGCLMVAFLLIATFIKPLLALAMHAAAVELHSQILLVPFISAYLIYVQRDRLPRSYSRSLGATLALVAVGVAFLCCAWKFHGGSVSLSENDFLSLTTLSFLSFLAADGFLFLGREWMESVAFPIGFLIFMVPLPDAMVEWMETASKLGSADAANMFFQLTGTPALRDGTIFHLPGIIIEVAQECSGIRSSWVLFITSLLASHMFLKSPCRRLVLVAFVIPLGLLRNGFRILVISMLCVHIGPHMIHSIVHKKGGPLFFALSLIPLFALLWWLRKGETVEKADQPVQAGLP